MHGLPMGRVELCEDSSIFHRPVWYRALSLRYACAIRRSGIIHTPGYPCAKFSSCRALHCELARGEKKLRTQSLTHSITQLI